MGTGRADGDGAEHGRSLAACGCERGRADRLDRAVRCRVDLDGAVAQRDELRRAERRKVRGAGELLGVASDGSLAHLPQLLPEHGPADDADHAAIGREQRVPRELSSLGLDSRAEAQHRPSGVLHPTARAEVNRRGGRALVGGAGAAQDRELLLEQHEPVGPQLVGTVSLDDGARWQPHPDHIWQDGRGGLAREHRRQRAKPRAVQAQRVCQGAHQACMRLRAVRAFFGGNHVRWERGRPAPAIRVEEDAEIVT